MKTNQRFILASGSPRRRELLEKCGFVFEVEVAGCDETPMSGESAEDLVQRLAVLKAEAVASKNFDALVLGADTMVVCDSKILGKPKDPDDAACFLRKLSGREHQVMTAFSIQAAERGVKRVKLSKTSVKFREIAASEIKSYVETDEPLDKAGAYGIQGRASAFVESISGSYSNVVGLDVCAVLSTLIEIGAVEV